MKVTVNFDMTPEEARKMMGLPDIAPLQEAMMEKMKVQMEEYFASFSDPELAFSKLMPLGIQTMENYQNFFKEMANASMSHTSASSNSGSDTNK